MEESIAAALKKNSGACHDDSAHLLWLLFTNVGTTQHGGFDCGQDFELSADGGNTLTNLKQDQEARSQKIVQK